MDLTKITDLELEVLDAVFCSFDQGDVGNDLESPRRNEEQQNRICEIYAQMRDTIKKLSLQRQSLQRHGWVLEDDA